MGKITFHKRWKLVLSNNIISVWKIIILIFKLVKKALRILVKIKLLNYLCCKNSFEIWWQGNIKTLFKVFFCCGRENWSLVFNMAFSSFSIYELHVQKGLVQTDEKILSLLKTDPNCNWFLSHFMWLLWISHTIFLRESQVKLFHEQRKRHLNEPKKFSQKKMKRDYFTTTNAKWKCIVWIQRN